MDHSSRIVLVRFIAPWLVTLAIAAVVPTVPVSAAIPVAHVAPKPLTVEELRVKDALSRLLQAEDDAIVRKDASALKALYTDGNGRDALKHAGARMDFLGAWRSVRHVRIDAVAVEVRTPGIKFRDTGRVRVSAVVSEKFIYHHREQAEGSGAFGLGTRRWYVLQETPAGWLIDSEDYTDPLDQDTRIPGEALPSETAMQRVASPADAAATAGAAAAVRYADRYCGAAPGCGNDRRYNPRYTDFNGEGGDCTNFVSQSLRAAGFRPTAAWSWSSRKADGTRPWSNADGLVDYLASSGRGRILAVGTYAALTRPSLRFPRAPIAAVGPGDLIGYREKDRVVHLALVVGRDASGYVLVDSHTADRYHVPWDIGWDRSTRFYLIKVRYPHAKGEGGTAQTRVPRRAASPVGL